MPDPTSPPTAPVVPAAPGPVLPSTADEVPYVPVSWLAVAAATVAAAFVVILAVAGGVARSERRPLLMEWLLALPVLAVILSFAARRVIRDAEGTRTGVLFGVNLPDAAWWSAVVVGLGYVAYLVAIDFSIRQEARAEAQRWVEFVQKHESARAFHRTRDPNQRATYPPTDAAGLEKMWGNEFVAFQQADLVRLLDRNPQAEFATTGLREWAIKSRTVECVVSGTLRCAEGEFPVQIPMQGVETGTGAGGGGRQWQVTLLPGGGYVQWDQARFTPYGKFVADAERRGGGFARAFLRDCVERGARPYAYAQYAGAEQDPAFRPFTPAAQSARMAAGGIAGFAWSPPAKDYQAIADRLFTLPGGAAPSSEQAGTFRSAWDGVGVVPAGVRLKNSPDVRDQVAVTDTAIEVRVPVEIPLPSTARDVSVARGRLVVTCTDPALVAEANRLRASANPADAGPITADDPGRKFAWKVVRIESDLRPVSARQQGPPGPGQGMPGGPEGP